MRAAPPDADLIGSNALRRSYTQGWHIKTGLPWTGEWVMSRERQLTGEEWNSVQAPRSQPSSLSGAQSAWRKEGLFLTLTKAPCEPPAALAFVGKSQKMPT